MRILRICLISVAVVLVAALVLLGLAFSPTLQTIFANRALSRPGVKGSVEAVEAGFSHLQMINMRLESKGVSLTVPELEADLPMRTAVLNRRYPIRKLVVKGWTLDLTGKPAGQPAGATATNDKSNPPSPAVPAALPKEETTKAQLATQAISTVLGQWQLPANTTIDDLELDGVVLLPGESADAPIHMHFTIKGGPVAPGKPGDLAVDAATTIVTTLLPIYSFAAHGRANVTLSPSGQFEGIGFKGNLSSDGKPLPEDVLFRAAVAKTAQNEETYSAALSRGGRDLAAITARLPNEGARFSGTWNIAVRDADLAEFFVDPLPLTSFHGAGQFDADFAGVSTHLKGHLNTTPRLGVVPSLATLGTIALEADFDLIHTSKSLHVDHLSASVTNPQPVLTVESAQAFTVDENTGALKAAQPGSDLLRGTLHSIPLGMLPTLIDGVVLKGSPITGDFAVQTNETGVTIRSTTPLKATGVSIEKTGTTLARNLDVSAVVTAKNSAKGGWELNASPLLFDCAGHHLAKIEATASLQKDAYGRTPIHATWTLDLDALKSQPVLPNVAWIRGQNATGEFTFNAGAAADLTGKINVTGHSPKDSAVVTVNANIDDYASASFRVPVKVTRGSAVSELSIDGSWKQKADGPRIDVEVSGLKVYLEDLELLAGSAFAAGGVPVPAAVSDTTRKQSGYSRDLLPFWGSLVGPIRLHVNHLEVGSRELNEVVASVDFDQKSLHVNGARASFNPISVDRVDRSKVAEMQLEATSAFSAEGVVSFDPSTEAPYTAKFTGGVDDIDMARLFGTPQNDPDAMLDGRCTLAATVTASGTNLDDLIAHRREEYRLTSKSGITRLLKTNVAASIPDAPTPVSDAVAGVGSAFGSLFGMKAHTSGARSVSKTMDAVLDVTYQLREASYTDLSVTATVRPDHVIVLSDFAMTAKNQRLTGTGQIAYFPNQPIKQRPLSLDLRLGVKGVIAERLTTAGLMTQDKDDQGYSKFRDLLHFGGTLEKVDRAQWHDLLVKAATAPGAK